MCALVLSGCMGNTTPEQNRAIGTAIAANVASDALMSSGSNAGLIGGVMLDNVANAQVATLQSDPSMAPNPVNCGDMRNAIIALREAGESTLEAEAVYREQGCFPWSRWQSPCCARGQG